MYQLTRPWAIKIAYSWKQFSNWLDKIMQYWYETMHLPVCECLILTKMKCHRVDQGPLINLWIIQKPGWITSGRWGTNYKKTQLQSTHQIYSIKILCYFYNNVEQVRSDLLHKWCLAILLYYCGHKGFKSGGSPISQIKTLVPIIQYITKL